MDLRNTEWNDGDWETRDHWHAFAKVYEKNPNEGKGCHIFDEDDRVLHSFGKSLKSVVPNQGIAYEVVMFDCPAQTTTLQGLNWVGLISLETVLSKRRAFLRTMRGLGGRLMFEINTFDPPFNIEIISSIFGRPLQLEWSFVLE